LWQKLLFWFNRNVCLALPSCAIPYGQRYIKITLAPKEKMIMPAASVFHAFDVYNRVYNIDGVNRTLVNNANLEVDGIRMSSCLNIPGDSLPADWNGNVPWGINTLPLTESTRVTRHYVPRIVGSVINYPTILSANIYANNIFTHSVLHDIFVNTVGYTLIRIHKTQ
jgi:hypothetical protein